MKILLTAINAKYIHSNLAVYSLRAASGPYRDQVELAEFTINNQKDYILEEIFKRKPDVLCFSVYIWNLEYVESVAKTFHMLCPDVPIWVGGPEVSYEVKPFLESHPYIKGVMIGEGEMTFREFCGCMAESGCGNSRRMTDPETDRLLEQVDGLAFRREKCPEASVGEFCFTSPRAPMDMSDIPFAYDTTADFSNRIIYYESSRGCPFSCSYCLSSVDKHLRFRKNELVMPELQFFIDQKVPQIKFVDRTFNCWHKHAMEIWQYLIDHDNGVTNFHFEISADLLNEEELQLMATMRPGLIQLEIGVQSTNPQTIDEIHRTMNLDELKRIVRRIQAGGNIHEHLDLIAGLPYEDYESFRHSFDEIYALKPNQLQLGFLKVLKGSYMYDHASEYGLVYHAEPPYEVLYTDWLSYEDVLKIKRVEEMLEVYYNSGQFEITMKILECMYGSPFEFFQRLGDFYERKGYFGMSHSRIRRCEILLEFLEACPPADLPDEETGSACKTDLRVLLEEALTFDLYYRENCKSRPPWAPSPSEWKDLTRKYCTNGKMTHLEPFHYAFPDKATRTLAELPARNAEPLWILFDYENRDPLDHQARTERMPGALLNLSE